MRSRSKDFLSPKKSGNSNTKHLLAKSDNKRRIQLEAIKDSERLDFIKNQEAFTKDGLLKIQNITPNSQNIEETYPPYSEKYKAKGFHRLLRLGGSNKKDHNRTVNDTIKVAQIHPEIAKSAAK